MVLLASTSPRWAYGHPAFSPQRRNQYISHLYSMPLQKLRLQTKPSKSIFVITFLKYWTRSQVFAFFFGHSSNLLDSQLVEETYHPFTDWFAASRLTQGKRYHCLSLFVLFLFREIDDIRKEKKKKSPKDLDAACVLACICNHPIIMNWPRYCLALSPS